MQGCGPKDHREGPSTVCALLVFFRAGKKKKETENVSKNSGVEPRGRKSKIDLNREHAMS